MSTNRVKHWCVVIVLALFTLGPQGCLNPTRSDLSPEQLAPPGTPLPELPKGDVYADEDKIPSDMPIESGDTVEVVIRQGTKEETFSSVVGKEGKVQAAFLEVKVQGMTAAQAEEAIRKAVRPYFKSPRVQVQIKKKTVTVKRIFVFGDVGKPGVYPMPRKATVLQAIGLAESFKETAILDEIRVIRLSSGQPEVITADLSRLFTYGDWSRNINLKENDVVFVPRIRLGDVEAFARSALPLVWTAITPLWGAIIVKDLVVP